ncbi:MliC family protein [Paraburkholderia sp. GAS334]|uniref:MliC family protein n=1 Tax=unclassified Paraburkholderia TaxID=2615204 RepID=UPI003D233BD0
MKTGFGVASAVLGAVVFCHAASAESFRLAEIQPKDRHTSKYTCATGRVLQVTYWNTANGQSFALVPVKGQQLLFVNTLSASGVKYQAGSYTWWTKGPRADLYDAMNGEDAPPVLSDCVTIIR